MGQLSKAYCRSCRCPQREEKKNREALGIPPALLLQRVFGS